MLPPALEPESSALSRVVGEGRTKQLLRVMKLTAIILLTACLTAGAKGYSQITLTAKNAPLHKVFKEIQRQSGFDFFYNYELIEQAGSVTVNVYDVPLEKAIEECLKGKGLTYEIISRTVVIKKKETTTISAEKFSSAIDVRGRVTNQSGEPVEGASVVVKGTNNGTTTNSEGYFELKNVDENASLVITGTNIETIEVRVEGRTVLAIKAVIKIEAQEEVVINAGYYKVTDKEKTGSISRVDSRVIEKQPISNPLQALQGRMAGVQIQQTTGVPGGGFQIQIRGRNSLRDDGNSPLYVIDGVPYTPTPLTTTSIGRSIIKEGNPLAVINPYDIASIEVLKDADATAIYGSRGANGVVLITTKKGGAGKTKVDLNFFQGFGKVSNNLNLLSTKDHVRMRIEALQNDGFWPLPPSFYSFVPDVFIWDTTRYTDWQKELIGGTAAITNGQFRFSGGNTNNQFSFGGGYYREGSVFPGSFYFSRLNGNATFNHISENRKLNILFTANYSASLNRQLATDLSGFAVTLAPNAPALYTPGGQFNWDWQNDFVQNPLAETKKPYKSNTYNLIANSSISYRIFPSLSIKLSSGLTNIHTTDFSANPLGAIPPQYLAGQTGTSNFGKGHLRTWIIEPQTDFNSNVGKGNLTITTGATLQKSIQEGEAILAGGYTSDALLENIRAATNISITSSSYSQYNYSAFFARLNYNLYKKYIFNLTGRRDGSSRFGPGKQFGNFGAVGTAWIFSNEEFMIKALPFLSFGKIRLSYGSTGSDAIGNYQYLNTYTPLTYPYNGGTGLAITRLDNPDYSWEVNKKFEAAIDLGFFADRINVSVNWYNNRSSNQLVGLPLPAVTGQSSVQYNLPAIVRNSGWEFQLNTKNFTSRHFSWETDFNITVPRNELLQFPGLESYPAYKNQYQVGKSIYTKRTLMFNGVDPSTGLYIFEDVNGDGNISTTDDGLFLKEVSQQYFGGIANKLRFKNLTLDFLFQFVKQTGFNYINSFESPGAFSNQPQIVVKRWQKPGDYSEIQQYSLVGPGSSTYLNYRFSDAAISDASFIRLKNLSLSWEMSEKIKQKIKASGFRIYLQGQNLLTITDYLGMDPENQNVLYLPPLRVITAGIQVTF